MRFDHNKNTKVPYYLRNIIRLFIPGFIYRAKLARVLKNIVINDYIESRVAYYNKLNEKFSLPDNANSISDFKKEKKKTYYFDLLEYFRFFDTTKKIMYLFGDIIDIPKNPSFVKSRPIDGDNKNSVLMKLDKVRHFIYVNDKLKFEEKKGMAVWRGIAHNLQRQKVIYQYFNHPLCDIAHSRKNDIINNDCYRKKMSLNEQLQFKYILSIEGNDVASNLKWIMSSNSLAFMPKPKYETWFMEGTLIANHHYVLVNDDFSDLEDKINYYNLHTEEAKKIISNANKYINQFKNKKTEDEISLLVLNKYFEKSGQ